MPENKIISLPSTPWLVLLLTESTRLDVISTFRDTAAAIALVFRFVTNVRKPLSSMCFVFLSNAVFIVFWYHV